MLASDHEEQRGKFGCNAALGGAFGFHVDGLLLLFHFQCYVVNESDIGVARNKLI